MLSRLDLPSGRYNPKVRAGQFDSIQLRHILDVPLALLHAPFIAGLVFGAYQRVGTAALIGGAIQVAAVDADRCFNMPP